MWQYVRGKQSKNRIKWECTRGRGEAGWPEDGLMIGIHLVIPSESDFAADSITRDLVNENAVSWISFEENKWRIDLDDLHESFPNINPFDWAHGVVAMNPEFDRSSVGLVRYEGHRPPTVAFHLTPDNIGFYRVPSTEGSSDEMLKAKGARADDNEDQKRSSTPDADFEFLERRDGGLYGNVWKGCQDSLDRFVAIKIIRLSMANLASAREHALALARLQTENVVTVYQIAKVCDPDSGEVVDGVIMEWLEGETLDDRLSGSLFSREESQQILNGMLRGLRQVHTQKLTHGDLHEKNVILANDVVKIIDLTYCSTHSLAMLNATARENRMQADMDSLRYLIRRVLHHSDEDPPSIGRCADQLREAKSVYDAQSIVDDLFSSLDDDIDPVVAFRDDSAADLLTKLQQKMPELIDEMKEDVAGDESGVVREFFVLPRKSVPVNSRKPRFAYFEDAHPHLRNKLDLLEDQGFITDVTVGNTPIYRMSEEFADWLLGE